MAASMFILSFETPFTIRSTLTQELSQINSVVVFNIAYMHLTNIYTLTI